MIECLCCWLVGGAVDKVQRKAVDEVEHKQKDTRTGENKTLPAPELCDETERTSNGVQATGKETTSNGAGNGRQGHGRRGHWERSRAGSCLGLQGAGRLGGEHCRFGP